MSVQRTQHEGGRHIRTIQPIRERFTVLGWQNVMDKPCRFQSDPRLRVVEEWPGSGAFVAASARERRRAHRRRGMFTRTHQFLFRTSRQGQDGGVTQIASRSALSSIRLSSVFQRFSISF